MELKSILNKLLESQRLSHLEARDLMHGIAGGAVNEAQMSAVLTAYVMRSISLDELIGFREALLELSQEVKLLNGEVIDLCGTGGDGKNTFNISTASTFVVAGANVPVAKHGNYSASSITGSSNIMEYLGYSFSSNPDKLKREIEQTNVCFLHAPLFHPALKAIGPVRRQLGVKTFFNMLGPLINPARPKYQLSGVFNAEVGRMFSCLFNRCLTDYRVVYSLDGYDEISLTSDVKVFSKMGDECFSPESIGFSRLSPSCAAGGATVEESAGIFLSVLGNQADKGKISIIIANSALAISCFKGISITEAAHQAQESIESGRAMEQLKRLLAMQ